jgi:hypothetical protein
MNAPMPPQPPPASFFVLSVVASLLLAGGLAGLLVPELLPPLAHPPVAWALIGVGAVFEIWSVAMLLATTRRNAAKADRGR